LLGETVRLSLLNTWSTIPYSWGLLALTFDIGGLAPASQAALTSIARCLIQRGSLDRRLSLPVDFSLAGFLSA
jgi:hypothetical protein